MTHAAMTTTPQNVTSPSPTAFGRPLLELRGVSKSFGRQQVLREVSFTVRRGESVALIGESGCGKSVTMKIMADLLKADRGEVAWNGIPSHKPSPAELRRRRLKIGYLFQGAALFDSLTVYDNIAFGLRENKPEMSRAAVRETVLRQLHAVGLNADVSKKRPGELSGGMRKRVGLARSLALDPEIMMYDEPTTGLDPIMIDVINELIVRTRAERPVTSIIVTHEMITVRKAADRVVMLYPLAQLGPDDPQVVFDGTVDEAFASEDPRIFDFVHGHAGGRLQELISD